MDESSVAVVHIVQDKDIRRVPRVRRLCKHIQGPMVGRSGVSDVGWMVAKFGYGEGVDRESNANICSRFRFL